MALLPLPAASVPSCVSPWICLIVMLVFLQRRPPRLPRYTVFWPISPPILGLLLYLFQCLPPPIPQLVSQSIIMLFLEYVLWPSLAPVLPLESSNRLKTSSAHFCTAFAVILTDMAAELTTWPAVRRRSGV